MLAAGVAAGFGAVLEAELGELQLANTVDAANDVTAIKKKRRLIFIKEIFMRSPPFIYSLIEFVRL